MREDQTDSTAIGLHRLESQRLSGERLASPEEAVRWMGALQAQAYGQVMWAIGLRTRGAVLADVERAIAQRRILLTWPLRGTLHAVPAEDVAWLLTLSAPRTLRASLGRRAQLGLDDAVIDRCAALLHEALAGNRRLTRPAVLALLEDAGISTAGQRGYHILWHLAHTGLICLGPLEGSQQTIVLLEEWVPGARTLPREEALTELARRYFTSHGPATLADFARWSGLTTKEAREGLGGAAHGLVSRGWAGAEYWMGAEVAPPGPRAAPQVYLLPGFDEYVLGYKDRTDILAPEDAGKIAPGQNGIFLPVIVVDGRVAGTWARTHGRRDVRLTLRPFAPLAAPRESLDAAARAYGAFIGLPVSAVDLVDP